MTPDSEEAMSREAKPLLSVIIITKNEESVIRSCLASVQWADEIIVLDSGSEDDTVTICREYTDKVYVTDWPGYGRQKNRALAYVTGEWVLALDADERVSPELKASIQQAICSEQPAVAYYCQRRSQFLGKTMYHGDWGSDKCLRLFKKGHAHFSEDLVHERLIPQGPTAQLTGFLWHDSIADFSELLIKLERYSTLGAQMKLAQGKRSGVVKAFGKALWSFLRGYVLRLGFLDGTKGLLLAIANAEGTYYRYLKVWFMQELAEKKSAPKRAR